MNTFTFEHVDVKTELVNRLNSELPKYNYGYVKVLKSDPQSPSELPCIGINRVSDSETSNSIADASGTLYDSTTKTNQTFFGTYFAEAMEVRVWHTNADERDKLYQTMKAVLFAMRQDLVPLGLLNLTMSGGRDEQDSTMAQAPMVLYWATITMSYLNPLDVTFSETVDAITSVTGTITPTQGG